MTKVEFVVLLFNHVYLYVFLALSSLVLYILIFKRFIYTVIDPIIFYIVLTFSFSLSDIVFLNILGYLRNYYLIYFILSQIFFILGYYVFKPFKYKIHKIQLNQHSMPKDTSYVKVIFIISISLYFISQLIVYIYLGIPLLKASRFDTFARGGGAGILDRIIRVTRVISVFLLFYYTIYFKNNIIKKSIYSILWIIIIIFSSLSGSKMGVLDIIYISFFTYIYAYKLGYNTDKVKNRIKKIAAVFFVISLIAALSTIAVQSNIASNKSIKSVRIQDTVGNLLDALMIRFVMNGDIYIMSYPNDVLQHLKHNNPFIDLFRGPLGAFRIIPYKDMLPCLGLRVMYYHHPYIEYKTGPTDHFDAFGLFNFGFLPSLTFAFLVGLLCSLAYNGFYYIARENIISCMIYSLITYQSLALPLNVELNIDRLTNIFVLLPIILGVSRIIAFSASKHKISNSNLNAVKEVGQ